MNLSSPTQVPVGLAHPCPVHIRLVTPPYPDGLLLAQSLRVLSGGDVDWFSGIEALLQSLQQDTAVPVDLLVCDWTLFRDKAARHGRLIEQQGMGERLILVADAQAQQAVFSAPFVLPSGTRWLLRPWRLADLTSLLGPPNPPPRPPTASHTQWQ